jgi:hypothetical protein
VDEYRKRKGMLVRIVHKNQRLVGRYLRSEKVLGVWTPVFRVGRKMLRGYECWWLPLSVAELAEATTAAS